MKTNNEYCTAEATQLSYMEFLRTRHITTLMGLSARANNVMKVSNMFCSNNRKRVQVLRTRSSLQLHILRDLLAPPFLHRQSPLLYPGALHSLHFTPHHERSPSPFPNHPLLLHHNPSTSIFIDPHIMRPPTLALAPPLSREQRAP